MENIQSAINAYFLGERNEMISIIVGSVMVSTCIILLNRKYQRNLIKSISWSVSASGLLLSATAISLLFRDAELRNTLLSGLSASHTTELLTTELQRINTVVGKYRIYQCVSAGIIVSSLFAVFFSKHSTVRGISIGLILLSIAQLAIDHYSENRAIQYQNQLFHALYSTLK
ncbi:hypothetical protein KDW99_14300 [Marinomonas rhizomae]|uniref:hypothetical protein n=1 Tax=Marinomonas rhizomae TaxID=491948 RepID=UPI002104AE6F|nr:hypothetical protein [Marinomonas rhizomae]UTV98427.1 hypothetical protein KDW99_14300 [Marinomonas rhizomae]